VQSDPELLSHCLISINGSRIRMLEIDNELREPAVMIICSCNVFSDGDVRALIEARPPAPGTAQIFRGLGHEPQCGRCARTIRKIMAEAPPTSGERY
jgi:bacterioferritin-associated ferredoxin